MNGTEARWWLADNLTEIVGQVANVYRYPAEAAMAPAVVITDGDPVLSITSLGRLRGEYSVRLVLLVSMNDNEAALEQLETLSDLLIQGLPKETIQFSLVSATSITTLGSSEYYSRELPLTLTIDL